MHTYIIQQVYDNDYQKICHRASLAAIAITSTNCGSETVRVKVKVKVNEISHVTFTRRLYTGHLSSAEQQLLQYT